VLNSDDSPGLDSRSLSMSLKKLVADPSPLADA
jgi:hypothetical protein